jgi:hypothetical protein
MTGSMWMDVLLFVAFIALLSIGMFRLDTIISTSRPKPNKPQKSFCGVEAGGKMSFTDPDGRDPRRKRRHEPKLISPLTPTSRRPRARVVRDINS